MSIDNPRIALVCGMSDAGKSTFINIATGSNLAVGHGDESETSEITTWGIPLININGVYVQLVDVPGFDDTRDPSDTEIYLHLTTWLSARYPGDMRVSWLIYLRPISKPKVDKLEASFIGMFKALVGEQHLDHVLLLTNRWNSPPDRGTEELEAKLASDVKYFGTRDGKIVKTGRIMGELTQDDAHRIITPLCHLPPITLQVQHETIEEGLSALDATAGRRLNDYMRGRAPELVERAEKALKDARESKRRLEEERRRAQAAQDEKSRLEAELCRREKEECERRKRERRKKRKFGNILSGVLGVAGAIIGGPVGAGVGIAAGQAAGHDDRSCSVECPHR